MSLQATSLLLIVQAMLIQVPLNLKHALLANTVQMDKEHVRRVHRIIRAVAERRRVLAMRAMAAPIAA